MPTIKYLEIHTYKREIGFTGLDADGEKAVNNYVASGAAEDPDDIMDKIEELGGEVTKEPYDGLEEPYSTEFRLM